MANTSRLILNEPSPLDRECLRGADNRRPMTVRKRIADLAVWAVVRGGSVWPDVIKEIEWEVENLEDAIARRKAIVMIRAAEKAKAGATR